LEFFPPELSEYIANHSSPEPELLRELDRETHAKILMPRMLSGHFQGRLLSIISKLLTPQRILEIGTYTGYSAICLAEGLSDKGKLITLDINDELRSMVERYVNKAGLENKIEILNGDACKIIPTLTDLFDLVFIDADKINYSVYYDLVFDKVKPGGIILADNVLWSGKVIESNPDKDTQAIIEFNKKVMDDIRTEKIILPVRDGITLIRKK
jgi:caffeoyl-CoA O-methyltransferase